MEYETEEQQLEAIKKWWKENSTMIIIGIVVGVGAIFGWQNYQSQSIIHTEEGSVIYEQVLINIQDPSKLNEQLTRVNRLQAEYTDTPYAGLSALLLAKQQLAAGEIEKAQQQYQWLISNARQDELKYLAKIRLSRLLLTSQQADQALVLLNESFPESFKAMVLELKGDVFLTQGKTQQAKAAYTQALSLSSTSNRWLQLKIDDAGEATVNTKDNIASEPSA